MRCARELPQARDLTGNLVDLQWRSLGELIVVSGAVLACDPFAWASDTPPLPYTFARGRYSVRAAIANIQGHERVALALLLLSERAVRRWQDQDDAPHYFVDSGVGSFMDREAAPVLLEKMSADKYYHEQVFAQMEQRSRSWPWTNLALDPVTGTNLIAIVMGWGDGLYATRTGYDADGVSACLATNFRVIDLTVLTES